MSYENPRIPEGINVSKESVGEEFVRLVAGLAVVLVVLGTVLFAGAGWLSRYIPYSVEARWVGDTVPGPQPDAHADAATLARLQTLVMELAADMPLPAGMQPRVHLLAEDTPNAFATLGGHILVTTGLYRRMPSENALAMVLAHEIAHLGARDPIAALGGGALVSLLLATISGEVPQLAPEVVQLVQLGYSRRVEARADAAALPALRARYGHAGGAADAFRVLADATAAEPRMPTFLSTHPADAARIARLESAARDWDPLLQPLRPLPGPSTR